MRFTSISLKDSGNIPGAGKLVFSPTLGWPVAIILILLLTVGILYELFSFKRSNSTNSDETLGMKLRRIAICFTLMTCALTPSIMRTTWQRAVSATNVIIVIDNTGSMNVRDASYSKDKNIRRLEAARSIVSDITKAYANASFSAIRFGSTTSVDVPLTPDTKAIDNWASALRTEPTGISTGTSLDCPLNKTLLVLKSIHDAHPDDVTVMYLISDGEETTSRKRRSYSPLRAYLTHSYIVGVGSKQGEKIPVSDEPVDDMANGTINSGSSSGSNSKNTNSQKWVIDPATGNPGISKLDENNLKNIADEVSGTYVYSQYQHNLGSEAKSILSKQWRNNETAKPRLRPEPVVWPCAMIASVLVLCELASWVITSRRLV